MPLIRRWKALPFVWQLALLFCIALVLLGGLVIGLVANATAKSAAREASGVANCVNTALGDRTASTSRDATAHVAFAEADKAYDQALVAVLLTPKGPAQLQPFKAFVLAAQRKSAADRRYVRQLRSDQRYRTRHPLGRC